MPDIRERPTAEYIADMQAHWAEVWTTARSEWRMDDAYRLGTYELWPKGLPRPKHYPSRAYDMIEHASNNLLAYDPVIHVSPAGEGGQHEKRADRKEPFLGAVFREASLEEPSLVFPGLGKQLMSYGMAVLKGPLLEMRNKPVLPVKKGQSDKEWADTEHRYEREMQGWMPFRLKLVHPARVLLDPREKRPTEVIEVGKTYAGDLEALSIRKKTQGRMADRYDYEGLGMKRWTQVDTWEYFSDFWHTLGTADGKMVFVEENTWRFTPFQFCYSGFGQEPVDFEQYDPSYLAVSLLRYLRDTLKRDAQQTAAKHNALIGAAFPQLMVVGKNGQEIAEMIARGEIGEDVAKDQLWWLGFPDLPSWMFQVGQETDRALEFGSFSRSMAGQRAAGVTTVGQQEILDESASLKFEGAQKQLEHLASTAASNVLRLVEALAKTEPAGQSITVAGETLRQSDIDGQYSVKVTFERRNPQLFLAQRQDAREEFKLRLISRETYWSKARLEDASGERDRLLDDALDDDPRTKEAMLRLKAQEAGLGQVWEQLDKERQAQAMQPEQSGGNGQEPPTPGGGLAPGGAEAVKGYMNKRGLK